MSDTTSEVTAWFFDDYLPTWVAIGNGTIDRGPDFILNYWGSPLYHSNPDGVHWALDGEAVIKMLDALHVRLRANGYSHTEVPDQAVRVYHRNGAAIEVIWSRRRADESEVERLVVHFEVIRTDKGWRVAGIQSLTTDSDTLAEAWSRP